MPIVKDFSSLSLVRNDIVVRDGGHRCFAIATHDKKKETKQKKDG